MRKGLTTLLTVAIALASIQAMAKAPVIGDIRSPIVGNKVVASGVSASTQYIYPDAFNLDDVVTDDITTVTALKWSYEVVLPQRYAINGLVPIDSSTTDPVLPTTNQDIRHSRNLVANSNVPAVTEDGNPNTVTIRDINLYPYGGSPYVDPNPSFAGARPMQSQLVTFWCSDGNLATSETVMFYTDMTYTSNLPSGWNRLSAQPPSSQPVHPLDQLKPGSGAWGMYDQFGPGSFSPGCTSHALNGSGVCFNVSLTGQNWGSIQSPMPYFQLAKNKVYRVRLLMNGSQLSAGKTPFWDFIIENYSVTKAQGLNLYGMDAYFLDNEGGANAVLSKIDGTEMSVYWAPSAFTTDQWNTNAYSAANVAGKDPALRFRVLDVDASLGLGNEKKFGDICLQSVIVSAVDYASITTIKTVYSTATGGGLKATTATPGAGNIQARQLTGTTFGFASGIMTVTPAGNAGTDELAEISPATDTVNTFETSGIPNDSMNDNWPIAWEESKIYRLSVEMNALNATDAGKPWDVIYMDMGPPSNEMITENFITANKAIASPKAYDAAKPQKYIMFHNAGKVSKSAENRYKRLRWRLRFGNSTSLKWPNGEGSNQGAVQVRSVVVDMVNIPN